MEHDLLADRLGPPTCWLGTGPPAPITMRPNDRRPQCSWRCHPLRSQLSQPRGRKPRCLGGRFIQGCQRLPLSGRRRARRRCQLLSLGRRTPDPPEPARVGDLAWLALVAWLAAHGPDLSLGRWTHVRSQASTRITMPATCWRAALDLGSPGKGRDLAPASEARVPPHGMTR